MKMGVSSWLVVASISMAWCQPLLADVTQNVTDDIGDTDTVTDGQSQAQGQLQGQDQSQDQLQAQSTDLDNVGSSTINAGEYKNAYRGSFSQPVPPGNEGIGATSPWGAVGTTKQAEMTQLSLLFNMCEGKKDCQDRVREQSWHAIKPCRFLLIPGLERFKPLGGLACWKLGN